RMPVQEVLRGDRQEDAFLRLEPVRLAAAERGETVLVEVADVARAVPDRVAVADLRARVRLRLGGVFPRDRRSARADLSELARPGRESRRHPRDRPLLQRGVVR